MIKSNVHVRAIIILILLTGSVYAHAFSADFVWDDHYLIEQNPFIKSFSWLGTVFTSDLFAAYDGKDDIVYYRPLQTLSYSLDHAVWHLKPQGYHLTNILLHILAGILLYVFLWQISRRVEAGLLGAALFLIHPVQVDAVSYIAGRADLLAGCFSLGAIVAYMRAGGLILKKRGLLIWVSFFLYACALLSKEISVVVPVLLYVCARCRCEHDQERWQSPPLIGYILITVIYIVFRGMHMSPDVYARLGLAAGMHDIMPALLRAAIAFAVYIRFFIMPLGLHMFYVVPELTGGDYFPAVFFVIVGMTGMVISFRGKNKAIIFGWLWWGMCMMPVLAAVFLFKQVAPHWCYFPLMGLAVVIGGSVDACLMRCEGSVKLSDIVTRAILLICCAGLLIFYGVVTIDRTHAWKTERTLYAKILHYAPDNAEVYTNLGIDYSRSGDYPAAENALKTAYCNDPGDMRAMIAYGVLCYRRGDSSQAGIWFDKALHVAPSSAEPRKHLGILAYTEKRFDEAILFLCEARQYNPYDVESRLFLALSYDMVGDDLAAEREYRVAQRLDPYDQRVAQAWGHFYEKTGRLENAVQVYTEYLKNHSDATVIRYNSATVYTRLRQYDKAIPLFEHVLHEHPEDIDAANNLGICFLEQGDNERARAVWEDALLVSGNAPALSENLRRLSALERNEE